MMKEEDQSRRGTPFQRSVWKAIAMIPRGKVSSYGEIARYLGKARAVRAVGSAVGKNPYAPKIPCHRVVRADGRIGQYSGGEGIRSKIELLAGEGVRVERGRIIDFESVFFRFPKREERISR
jgi:O-6-methylguanine DNA methyltransferase